MKKIILIFALLSLLLMGCEKEEQKIDTEVDNTEKIIPSNNDGNKATISNYQIKNEDINEQEFLIAPENDKDGSLACNLYFSENHIYFYDSFGNTIRGDYSLSGDNIFVKFNGFHSDYSEKGQLIDVDVSLRMIDENTIIVKETPSAFNIKTSTYDGSGWKFDGGEKEMTFVGFVEGYHFYKVPTVGKIDDSKDWVSNADYEKNLKAESYVVADKTYYGNSIVVPFINIDSDYARQANNEIKSIFDEIVAHYNEGVDDGISYVDSCKYTVFTGEKGLFVLFSYGLGATDVVNPVYHTYSFDLVDGRKMDLEYYCSYIGFTKNEIIDIVENKINSIIREEMTGFEEEEIEEYIEKTKASFRAEFNTQNILFTVTEDGNPAVVVDIQIPAATGHFDALIEVVRD